MVFESHDLKRASLQLLIPQYHFLPQLSLSEMSTTHGLSFIQSSQMHINYSNIVQSSRSFSISQGLQWILRTKFYCNLERNMFLAFQLIVVYIKKKKQTQNPPNYFSFPTSLPQPGAFIGILVVCFAYLIFFPYQAVFGSYFSIDTPGVVGFIDVSISDCQETFS